MTDHPPYYYGPAPDDWPVSVAGPIEVCRDCGGTHETGSWACPELAPAPLGGRGDFHRCQRPTDPTCQGECGGAPGGW